MRLEEFAHPENRPRGSQRNIDLPLVDLATFIIYFLHWLMHPENVGLWAWAHPYRWIHRVAAQDRVQDTAFTVLPETLDEARVGRLIERVRPRDPRAGLMVRVPIFPASLHGSKLPFPVGMGRYTKPSQMLLTLIGFETQYRYGLPSYVPTGSSFCQVVLPQQSAEQYYYGEGDVYVPSTVQQTLDLQDPQRPGPRFLLCTNGDPSRNGQLWGPTFGPPDLGLEGMEEEKMEEQKSIQSQIFIRVIFQRNKINNKNLVD